MKPERKTHRRARNISITPLGYKILDAIDAGKYKTATVGELNARRAIARRSNGKTQ